MKNLKICLMLIAVILFNSACSNESDNQLVESIVDKNTNIFLESVAIIPQSRVDLPNGKFARNFILDIYDENYKPLSIYTLNNEDFSDNGLQNDKVTNDGIYTSALTENTDVDLSSLQNNITFKSDKFKHNNNNKNLQTEGGKIGCKFYHTNKGTSLLGFSCGNIGGCIVFYDCSFEISW